MKLNTAVLGAGQIVPDFLLSCQFVDEIHPYVIFGVEKDIPVMEKLAQEYKIDKVTTKYEEILEDECVDVVYVALPNSLHFEFAKKAILAKKHVIVEKPFCSTLAQAKELFALAEQQDVFIFEAIPNIHFPNFLKMKESLTKLGELKLIELNSAKYSSRYDDFKKGVILPAFDPKKDGGALMDMGVYNLNLLVGLFGKPKTVTYFPNIEREVDTSGILLADYGSFKASSVAGKDCVAPNCINLMGDKGYIHSTSRSNVITDFNLCIKGQAAQAINLHERKIHERLAYEIADFCEAICNQDNSSYQAWKKQTLSVMELLQEVRGK